LWRPGPLAFGFGEAHRGSLLALTMPVKKPRHWLLVSITIAFVILLRIGG
jgi:hypothetical protein